MRSKMHDQRLARLTLERRRARGTATVEAVITIPFFIIVFAGVLLVGSELFAQQSADNQARSCAWRWAMANCTGTPPAGCDNVLTSAHVHVGDSSDLQSAVNSVPAPFDKIITGVIDPLIDDLFGAATEAHTLRSVNRPALFGGGSLALAGKYRLACNLKQQTPGDILSDAWHAAGGP